MQAMTNYSIDDVNKCAHSANQQALQLIVVVTLKGCIWGVKEKQQTFLSNRNVETHRFDEKILIRCEEIEYIKETAKLQQRIRYISESKSHIPGNGKGKSEMQEWDWTTISIECIFALFFSWPQYHIIALSCYAFKRLLKKKKTVRQ